MLNVTGEGHGTVRARRKEDRADLTTETQAQVCSITLTFCGVDCGSCPSVSRLSSEVWRWVSPAARLQSPAKLHVWSQSQLSDARRSLTESGGVWRSLAESGGDWRRLAETAEFSRRGLLIVRSSCLAIWARKTLLSLIG